MGNCYCRPYGYPRIMSSYEWPRLIKDGRDVNDWIGPPSVSGHTKHVICNDGWVCEHRWKEIRNMVRYAYSETVSYYSNDHVSIIIIIIIIN